MGRLGGSSGRCLYVSAQAEYQTQNDLQLGDCVCRYHALPHEREEMRYRQRPRHQVPQTLPYTKGS